MQEDQNDQMYDFGLKIVIFDPFLTLPLWGKKILTLETWLKKSLVMPSWSQGAKLACKMPFMPICDFGRFPYTFLYKIAKITKAVF